MELLHWGPLAQVITKGGTTVNQEIMPAYAAYQKAIDLTLYHAFAELVIQTSQDDKATQKAAELGAVSVLARRYVNCYARDQYVSSPFYVYISKSKNGQQYLDSLGGAATTSRKEKYVEGAFLVERAALHTAGALPEKEE